MARCLDRPAMTPYLPPNADSSECLLRIVEAAPQVRRRYQFFLWSQGDLQRWLPHRLLVCAAYDRHQRDLVFDVFNSVPLPEPTLHGLRDSRAPLVALALMAWRRHRLQPCHVLLAEADDPDGHAAALLQAGYGHLLVHGLCRPGRPEEVESFFMFGLPDRRHEEADLQAIDMLLPCLHTTYQRVHVTERQMGGALPLATGGLTPGAARMPTLTDREREILQWVRHGLSNQQISDQLGISALTVKNHVQKILRKLDAANRAQAVAKAMMMNALGEAGGGGAAPKAGDS